MRVDLPAPFSPMSECTSPGNRRKSTPSSALTPGNVIEMPRISTTGAAGSVGLVTRRSIESGGGSSVGHGGCAGVAPRTRRPDRSTDASRHPSIGSVLPVGQGLDGLLLREGGLLGDDALLDLATLVEGLDDVDELLAEERRALHDE